ncbi:MAG TPA: class I SAM-dependent methyltransferase, partial [Thermoanaerobaculia bacterium]
RGAISGADAWVVVLEESALPVDSVPREPAAGAVSVAISATPVDPLFVHTLRELETSSLRASPDRRRPGPAALAFQSADHPPSKEETVSGFLLRLAASPAAAADSRFRVIRFDDPSEMERPELTRRLPAGAVRILDVGCGAGGAIASARAKNSRWSITGIERDPRLAGLARGRLDRVLEGDLTRLLPRLAEAGEQFDALVFADVLEHVDDPIGALSAGRALAAPGGMLLASVPNVGHVSIVRDLVAGRFDPIPAGLCDSGHLRWFTRSWLAEAIGEAGWQVISIEGEPGAPAPDAASFLEFAASFPGSDSESLSTYQWVAVGAAE